MKYLKKLFTLLVIALFACGFAACSSDDEDRRSLLWKLHLPIFMAHGSWLSGTVNLLLRAHTATSFSTART